VRTRSRNPFTTVTTSGLLLPVDLLTRVVDGDPDLKGLSPKDYHLRSSERLNEAAARAWNQCLAAWKSFRKKWDDLPASDTGTTLTRDEWLLPLFQELGYGRLQPKKAIQIEGKEYPISHGWENHVPIHLLSARLPLDRRTPGVSGAATRAPYSLLQEMLNRSSQYRWGFVSNGLKLFLLRDNAALARAANVEFDLESMMNGGTWWDFYLLFCLCHQSRVEIAEDGKPEDCWLEKWANLADSQGTRAREKLRDGVETAIKSLGAGFLTTKGSEELGSVYESLLELHPNIDTDEGPFTLGTAAGNERKTTGSYYTPRSLINCLLDSALDPVVSEAIDVPDPAEAEQKLLNLKVCDPACGSGHFLIAAAERMAMHLARLRTGDDQPNTLDVQHAKRDIIGRCIYGVDINPMAVELCKVSLWMEALEPGKPLSFLDHHIQCGNSLLGATPRLLAEGIPDDAFKPIEGDDKKVCAELKKSNKKEREDYQNRQGYLFEPVFKLGNVAAELAKLTAVEDDSLDSIAAKQQRYEDLVKGADYLKARFLADTWCATFVWKKDDSDLGRLCPSERKFRDIERNPHDVLPHVRHYVEQLSSKYGFFHWHLSFPDIFRPCSEAAVLEWKGGFDIVLGNPPWERVKLQEKEWFAGIRDDIAAAASASKRRKLISNLKDEDPELLNHFQNDARIAESISHFFRVSTRYPLCSRGDINTFAIFAELNRSLLGTGGNCGCVLPPGIATDDTYKQFIQDVVDRRSLRSFFAFTNRGYTFPGVESTLSFSLLVMANADVSKFHIAAKLWHVDQLKNAGRVYTLTPLEIRAINPNTRNLPIFESTLDAELVKQLQNRFPVLITDDPPINAWNVTFSSMFHMSNDSDDFKTLESMLEAGYSRDKNSLIGDGQILLPLYESKLIGQFNHRAATFEGIPQADRFKIRARTNSPEPQDLKDSIYCILPRYWIRSELVEEKSLCRWQIGFRNAISAVADSRSLVASVVPRAGVGNSLPIISTSLPERWAPCALLSYLNSFVADYLIRQKASGGNLNFYVMKQLPILPPSEFLSSPNWISIVQLGQWISAGTIELAYTATDLASFSFDCGYNGPPFRWDEERRFSIRCELDAAYFHLYLGSDDQWGADNPTLLEMFPTPRDAVDYIMDTFPIVRRKDEAKHNGDYRTKRTILEIYDQMAEAIRTGTPYQTHLIPPPGPPTDPEGNFIPCNEWSDEIRTVYKDVIHLDSDVDDEIEVPSANEDLLGGLAYPSPGYDHAVCSAAMQAVDQMRDIESAEHLDLVLLASHPQFCKPFLDEADATRLEQLTAAKDYPFKPADDQDVQWSRCREHLERRSAIQVDRSDDSQRISKGDDFDSVLAEFETETTELVALAVRALKAIRLLRQKLDSANQVQRFVIERLDEARLQYQLAA